MFGWLVCLLLSLGWVVQSQLETFVSYQQIPNHSGREASSFVMGDYGYFIITGGGQGCLQGYNHIYKYNNVSQQFVNVYTFPNSYRTYDIYPFVVDGKVLHTHSFFLCVCFLFFLHFF